VKVLFLHGWQSTPGGLKPTYLKDHGHTVLNPALPDDDFDAAVRIAQAEFDHGKPDVVIGSSRGGAVAMNIESDITPMVLLCPAWKRWGSATTVRPDTLILHAPADTVVPWIDSVDLLYNSGLDLPALIFVGQDHRMADLESLQAMEQAVFQVRGQWANRLTEYIQREQRRSPSRQKNR
jgi:hypothetical protein